jgi:hypothetical protein
LYYGFGDDMRYTEYTVADDGNSNVVANVVSFVVFAPFRIVNEITSKLQFLGVDMLRKVLMTMTICSAGLLLLDVPFVLLGFMDNFIPTSVKVISFALSFAGTWMSYGMSDVSFNLVSESEVKPTISVAQSSGSKKEEKDEEVSVSLDLGEEESAFGIDFKCVESLLNFVDTGNYPTVSKVSDISKVGITPEAYMASESHRLVKHLMDNLPKSAEDFIVPDYVKNLDFGLDLT